MPCDVFYPFKEVPGNQSIPISGGIIFNDDEIQLIKDTLKDLSWEKGMVETGGNDSDRISDIKFIPFNDKTMWFYQKIFKVAQGINDINYKFKLHGLVDQLQYGRYLKDGKYDFHIDIGVGKSGLRKLSCSILLSDPDDFEGGIFQYTQGPKISTYYLKKGEILFFPSWIRHRVKPITSGERLSLVGWFGGTHYK